MTTATGGSAFEAGTPRIKSSGGAERTGGGGGAGLTGLFTAFLELRGEEILGEEILGEKTEMKLFFVGAWVAGRGFLSSIRVRVKPSCLPRISKPRGGGGSGGLLAEVAKRGEPPLPFAVDRPTSFFGDLQTCVQTSF